MKRFKILFISGLSGTIVPVAFGHTEKELPKVLSECRDCYESRGKLLVEELEPSEMIAYTKQLA